MTSGRPVSRAAAICVRKPLRLRVARRLVVVVVEPRLADRHDLRMRRQPDQLVGRDVKLLGGVVRMRADRAIDLVMRLGDLKHAGKALHARRDRHHAADAGCDRARDHRIALLGEVGKIQVAMAVDEQDVSPCCGGRRRGCVLRSRSASRSTMSSPACASKSKKSASDAPSSANASGCISMIARWQRDSAPASDLSRSSSAPSMSQTRSNSLDGVALQHLPKRGRRAP